MVSRGGKLRRGAGTTTGPPPTTYLDVALHVLATADRPLTTREILTEALEFGLLRPVGKTPAATLSAALYGYTRDHPDGPLVRLQTPGPARARRGSVRWAFRETPDR